MLTSTRPSFTARRVAAFYTLLAALAVIMALAVTSCFAVPVVHATEVTGTSQHLITATATLNATGVTLTSAFMPRCRETTVYIQWGTGTASGAVTVETAHSESYTGTWAPLVVKAWSAASSEDVVQITGIHGALRTRISTVIGNGTIDTWAVCN